MRWPRILPALIPLVDGSRQGRLRGAPQIVGSFKPRLGKWLGILHWALGNGRHKCHRKRMARVEVVPWYGRDIRHAGVPLEV